MDASNDKSRSPSKYVCFKLSRAMRKVHRYYESNLSQYGITPAQFYVLSAVWERDGLKFKDLAKSLDMDGSTLTSILDRMERLDLVERRNDPEDRRSLLVFLKEKAKHKFAEITHLAEELQQEIKERFSDEEFAAFERVLDKFSQESSDS
ncbi:MarR family winged helix-turn-helix transcriptional regulator [Desulfosporosinus youngiae]|uniref:Transcriptional regulator n=1 Tax=Desulfosporosinus youngiae DSM 17734 TaxID=768710 RepID=H5Y3D7_9FIRM|nr:MarR family transcriptional regulator [Desulfosporosinus youngiae]EHQ88906.1 transcriptional regulator [Desulfosporosinus youngiae DSM 17734]